MNQKEAIELALEMHAECEKRDATGCRGCPFLLEDTDGYQESFCSITNIQEIGTERLIERLKQLDSSYAPSENSSDNVNSPAHYKRGGMECIDAIRALCEGLDGVEAYYVGNILKYIWRYKFKNGVEDLKKARHYLDWLIEQEETNAEQRLERR